MPRAPTIRRPSRKSARRSLRRAATAGHYPSSTLTLTTAISASLPAQSNGTWQVNGGLRYPYLRRRKSPSNILEADAQSKQSRSQFADLRGRIDYEVSRLALLDLSSAAEQVDVPAVRVELADRPSYPIEDRFTAGVADNLEVVQAQESVASAHENYIQSLYAHNLAKIELARAIGDAEQGVKRY